MKNATRRVARAYKRALAELASHFQNVEQFLYWRACQRRLANAHNALLSTELRVYSIEECANAVVELRPNIPLYAYGQLIQQLYDRSGRGEVQISEAIKLFEKEYNV